MTTDRAALLASEITGHISAFGTCNEDWWAQESVRLLNQALALLRSEATQEPLEPTLLEKAVSDRETRLWRYYHFERDDPKPVVEEVPRDAEAPGLSAQAQALRGPLRSHDSRGLSMPRLRHRHPDIDDLKTWSAAYVTPQQLADYWKVHVVTVQRWLRQGVLSGARFRGAWRVKTAAAQLFEQKLFTKSA